MLDALNLVDDWQNIIVIVSFSFVGLNLSINVRTVDVVKFKSSWFYYYFEVGLITFRIDIGLSFYYFRMAETLLNCCCLLCELYPTYYSTGLYI